MRFMTKTTTADSIGIFGAQTRKALIAFLNAGHGRSYERTVDEGVVEIRIIEGGNVLGCGRGVTLDNATRAALTTVGAL